MELNKNLLARYYAQLATLEMPEGGFTYQQVAETATQKFFLDGIGRVSRKQVIPVVKGMGCVGTSKGKLILQPRDGCCGGCGLGRRCDCVIIEPRLRRLLPGLNE